MTQCLAPAHHPPTELSHTEAQLLALARRVAKDSPDRSRKVGAVIVDPSDHRVVAVACNTLPEGVEHADEFLRRPEKYDWTEHAERNAIFEVAKSRGESTAGCTMVLPWFPCVQCARAIVQSGIKRVVAPYPDMGDPNWGKDFATALRILAKGSVAFDHFLDDAPPSRPRAEGDPLEVEHDPDDLPAQAWVDHWNAHRSLPEARPPRRPFAIKV